MLGVQSKFESPYATFQASQCYIVRRHGMRVARWVVLCHVLSLLMRFHKLIPSYIINVGSIIMCFDRNICLQEYVVKDGIQEHFVQDQQLIFYMPKKYLEWETISMQKIMFKFPAVEHCMVDSEIPMTCSEKGLQSTLYKCYTCKC